jgi:hypothetical protein
LSTGILEQVKLMEGNKGQVCVTVDRSVVPSLVGWHTPVRAFVNLLLFGLTALGGEWIVHQLEYLIESGGRLTSITATAPHRFYTGPGGAMLGAAVLVSLLATSQLMRANRRRHLRLVRLLPSRLHRFIPATPVPRPAPVSVAVTAILLAGYQAVVYAVQENVEYALVGSGWPGLSVLLAPQHATVLPLHLLIAICGSLILWTVTLRISAARGAVRCAETLVRLLIRAQPLPGTLQPGVVRLPDLRPLTGSLCPRAPPLAV